MDDSIEDLGTLFAELNASPQFVIGQLGQSLDGRIALPSGESKYINGASGLDHIHRIRAMVDAVLVGVGTVIADDPQLNVRRVPGRDPARVVLDPNGRLPASARCLQNDGARRLVVRRPSAAGALPDGVERVEVEGTGALDPAAVVAALRARGLKRILVEGGPRTLSAFLDGGAIDHFHIIVSPAILGSGRTGLDLKPITGLSAALRPTTRVHVFPDGDVLFACDLRRRAGGEGRQDHAHRDLCPAG